MTDYEKWKNWLNQWGIKYKEEIYDTLFHKKELYIGNTTSVVFDLNENFISFDTYDY